LIFTNPRPSPEQLRTFYNSNVYECHETAPTAAAASKAAHVFARAEQYLPASTPKTLLDYGAGGGTFLLDARKLGWKGWAFEPGRRGLGACRDAELPATADPAELPRGAFGLITLNHVLEHIADPRETLSSLRPLLAPGGRLCVEVPNAGSLRARLAGLMRGERIDEAYRAFPIHLMYYTARTLRRMLARAGWTVEATFTMGLGLDELYVAERKRGCSKPAANAPCGVRPAWRRAARDAFLSLGLGENLVAIAAPSRAA
jgi:SAM-dependent methyltransferase